MRIVLDRSVLLSAALNPKGPAAAILARVFEGRLVALYDDRMLGEYREGPCRPRFGFKPADVEGVLESLTLRGRRIEAEALATADVEDPADLPFLEVAVTGEADALVTGNVRRFGNVHGVLLLTPGPLLKVLGQ